MSAYGEQLRVMERIEELETELENVGDDMERCILIDMLFSGIYSD